MIDSIKNIYKSEDLHGDFLIQPLKKYHSFFAKKIVNSSGLKKVAWVVAVVVTGIFAYPGFGALAVLGIVVKLTGIPSLKKHNQVAKRDIEGVQLGIKSALGDFVENSSHSILQLNWQMNVVREFKMTKQNVDALTPTIKQEIDLLSSQFKKVYFASNGHIKNGVGEITIQLRVRKSV